jgi:hypothetical protein
MNAKEQPFFPVRVATLEIVDVAIELPSLDSQISSEPSDSRSCSGYSINLTLKAPAPDSNPATGNNAKHSKQISAAATDLHQAITDIVQQLCQQSSKGSLAITHCEATQAADGQSCCLLALASQRNNVSHRSGVGRATGPDEPTAVLLAAIRAANHAGLLDREYRANNQKLLREWLKKRQLKFTNYPPLILLTKSNNC